MLYLIVELAVAIFALAALVAGLVLYGLFLAVEWLYPRLTGRKPGLRAWYREIRAEGYRNRVRRRISEARSGATPRRDTR